MYTTAETIGSRADFSTGSTVYHVSNVPDLQARNPTLVKLDSEISDIDFDLASALFRLSEYGVDFPGIGNLIEREKINSSIER